MKLIINNPKYEHLTREIITAYFPKLKIETVDIIPDTEDYTQVDIQHQDAYVSYSATVRINGKVLCDNMQTKAEQKLNISKLLSGILKQFCPVDLPWGILTGIRPAKMVRELHTSGMTFDEINTLFCNQYEVHTDKARLATDVAKKEIAIIDNICKNGVSLYIGIPFCPTRCLYCSFTSQSIKFSNTLVEPYMSALFKEIDYMAQYLREKCIPIETLYIGGGTPTALDEYIFAHLLDKIRTSFDMSQLKEYTVEAGRPDTITEQKLRCMKNANVTRISINPQTMNQKTLDIIGRKHTPDDIVRCYELATAIGFDHINTDLIAGLPGEDIGDFEYTLDCIKKLNPSSVTVHTMSVKHGSYLDMNYSMYTPTAANTVNSMLTSADSLLRSLGKEPYYLYRQKNMLGNLENVGYCTPGNECLYNIYIMEEVQSILSLGAGGSTKIVNGDNIERVFNVKEVSEYIKRIDEMIDRKKSLL